MASLAEHLAAKIAFWHARPVHANFWRATRMSRVPSRWRSSAACTGCGSAFGREHSLANVCNAGDLRAACPIRTYDDFEPWLDRVAAGEFDAMFAPGVRPLMFATSSGTTATPKAHSRNAGVRGGLSAGVEHIGLKLLCDHPRAVLRPLLQSSGRWDRAHTPAGVPCGAINRSPCQNPEAGGAALLRWHSGSRAHRRCPARYYTLMRLGVTRDVAWAITASPATLIQMGRCRASAAKTSSVTCTMEPCQRKSSAMPISGRCSNGGCVRTSRAPGSWRKSVRRTAVFFARVITGGSSSWPAGWAAAWAFTWTGSRRGGGRCRCGIRAFWRARAA